MNSAESIQSLGKYLYLSHAYRQHCSMQASLLHTRAADSSTAITSVPVLLVPCSCCWVGWDQAHGLALPPVPLEMVSLQGMKGGISLKAEMLLLGAFTAVPELRAHHWLSMAVPWLQGAVLIGPLAN